MGKPPSKAPIVTRASFTITGAVYAGQLVGHMQSTNRPDSWTLSGCDYFEIDGNGVITVGAAGVDPLNQSMPDTTYTLTATAINKWGTGSAAAIVYREAYVLVPVTKEAIGKANGMGAVYSTSNAPLRAFPGQSGNPVGHKAAPGWPGAFTATYTSSNPIASYAATLPGGVINDGVTISFIKFDVGTSGATYVSKDGTGGGAALNNVTFLGCEFADSDPLTFVHVDCYSRGSDGITFKYCTFKPSVRSQPTHPDAWPSASVGTGQLWAAASPSPYAIPYTEGTFQHLAIAAPTGGQGITVDHCDFWGMGNIAIGIGTIGSTGVNKTGPLRITDNWIHDNRNDIPPVWTNGTYGVGALVATTDGLFIYKAINAGTNMTLPTPPASNANWAYQGTNDHTDQILVSNEWNAQNIIIDHNTCASFGNGNSIAFQPGNPSRSIYAPAETYSGNTPYSIGQNVTHPQSAAGSNSRQYQSKQNSNTGHTPTPGGDAWWADMGEAAYFNIQITNNYFSGYGYHTQVATNMFNCHHFTFTDNIYATDCWWSFGPVKGSDNPALNGANPQQTQWASANMLWRRNKLKIYPGSDASYASAYAGKDGYSIIPTNFGAGSLDFLSASDWTN